MALFQGPFVGGFHQWFGGGAPNYTCCDIQWDASSFHQAGTSFGQRSHRLALRDEQMGGLPQTSEQIAVFQPARLCPREKWK